MFVWDNKDLNDEQVEAVNEPGSVFLSACPGSGKTRTLTYRIAKQLSELKSEKQRVVAITFTHRAADEIHERIETMGVDTSQLWIGTIHAFCLEWIVRPYAGYHDDLKLGFRVINGHDTELLYEQIIEARNFKHLKVYDCGYFFTPETYQLSSSDTGKHRALHTLLADYWTILRENRQVDFEMILLYAYQQVVSVPVISTLLGSIFAAILVDEYQDTKEIQYAILASILKKSRGSATAFIVGDPNQAIFASLGGYAISPAEFSQLSGVKFREMDLSRNYRSSTRIVDYFAEYSVLPAKIQAVGENRDYPSVVTYNRGVSKDDLQTELVRFIKWNVEEKQVLPREICVIAPWWMHLASVARQLMTAMPEYSFDGPGMAPFARDPDNFWFKLSRIVLTVPSPSLFNKRRRWAGEVIEALTSAGISIGNLDRRGMLKICNSVRCDELDGLTYLRIAFDEVLEEAGIDFRQSKTLTEHHDAFFGSSERRIQRLIDEGAVAIADISMFRKVFSERSGITVSSIHGVKGAEFDVVISYGILDGMIPHFTDADQEASACKMLYVICSRARKHLHLISEVGRKRGRYGYYGPTPIIAERDYSYDDL